MELLRWSLAVAAALLLLATALVVAYPQDDGAIAFPGSNEEVGAKSADQKDCTTVDGPAKGQACVFPFTFDNITLDGCTTAADPEGKAWCSTQVDANGFHVAGGGHWAHCSEGCPRAKLPEAANGEETSSPSPAPAEGAGADTAVRFGAEHYRECKTKKEPSVSGLCKPTTLCVGLTSSEQNEEACELQEGNSVDVGVCCAEHTPAQEAAVAAAEADKIAVAVKAPEVEKVPTPASVTVNDVNSQIGVRFGFDAAAGEQPAGGIVFASAPAAEPTAPEAVAATAPVTDNLDTAQTDPTAFHLHFNKPSDEALVVDNITFGLVNTAATIQSEKNLSDTDAGIGLRAFNIDASPAIASVCPWTPAPVCSAGAKYRSFDGTCNNLAEPNFGRAVTPFQRILLPEYSGSLQLPRKAASGNELPSARVVSQSLSEEAGSGSNDVVDPEHTVLVMQMGQFIDHDLTHTPNHGLSCCGAGDTFPTSFDAEKCFPILIPQDDRFWKGTKTCMSFARSLASPGLKCELEFRQQMNQITHWLDGSNIYGSSSKASAQLREFFGGQLKVTRQVSSRTGALPSCADQGTASDGSTVSTCRGCSSCFFAGDFRVNEQLTLITMHTVWLREHNRVAAALRKLNPAWDDEKLYQEARRIVVAEYQHIVYKEWLPTVLGNQFMTVFGLWPLSKGYSSDYKTDFDPRITNEFATAAFRFGHSLVPNTVKKVQRSRQSSSNIKMVDSFFRPAEFKKSSTLISDLVRGMTMTAGERWDNVFASAVRDRLFESNGAGGLDLVALNVQRGRDHGLPGYNGYREICRTTASGRARDWVDMEELIPKDSVAKLAQVYESPDDVDLFVGGFLEAPHGDSVLGPTFKCLIGDQFARLKLGDRFFYDLGLDATTRFGDAQLQEIRKTSMSRVLCDNVDDLGTMQAQAFRTPGSSKANALQNCNSINIPSVNLAVFADRPSRR